MPTMNGRFGKPVNSRALDRLISYDPTLDSFNRYVADSPTPQRFATWLKNAETGDVAAIVELQQAMEARDAWLQGVTETRRGAVTALKWDVEPDLEDESREAEAKEVADYCRSVLRRIKAFPSTLEHLTSAIGPNVAVSELVWSKGELVDFVDVPAHRLQSHPWIDNQIWIDHSSSWQGIPTRSDAYGLVPKFVVFHTHANAGFPFRRTLTHATVWPYLIIHFTRVDWAAFSELYGHPIPVTKAEDGVPDPDRSTVQDFLTNRGSDSYLDVPEGITFDLLQVTSNGETFEKQMQWAQKTLAVLWLGQTLTTDVGDVGSKAAAQVHDNVRLDLLTADVQREARCIREQILEPMCQLKFPDREVPVPHFRRLIDIQPDIYPVIAQVRAAAELGLEVDEDEVYRRLNLTKPKEGLGRILVPASNSGPDDPAKQNSPLDKGE